MIELCPSILFCFIHCTKLLSQHHTRKRKAEDEPDCAPKKIKTEEEETVRKQSKTMFKYRDNLAKLLKKKELSYILEHNDQYMPTGDSKVCGEIPLVWGGIGLWLWISIIHIIIIVVLKTKGK